MSKSTAKTIKVTNTKWTVFDVSAIKRVFGRALVDVEAGKIKKRNAKGHFVGTELFRVATVR